MLKSAYLSTWNFVCFEPDGIYEYDIATFVETTEGAVPGNTIYVHATSIYDNSKDGLARVTVS